MRKIAMRIDEFCDELGFECDEIVHCVLELFWFFLRLDLFWWWRENADSVSDSVVMWHCVCGSL
jgi:hypothetical protein